MMISEKNDDDNDNDNNDNDDYDYDNDNAVFWQVWLLICGRCDCSYFFFFFFFSGLC